MGLRFTQSEFIVDIIKILLNYVPLLFFYYHNIENPRWRTPGGKCLRNSILLYKNGLKDSSLNYYIRATIIPRLFTIRYCHSGIVFGSFFVGTRLQQESRNALKVNTSLYRKHRPSNESDLPHFNGLLRILQPKN